ncbi:rhomboid family intramembrane serine protease [Sutcliffiella horikoshii]|uniref:rhomboid family intramembrane serine protease n=1 Tax=Sutcliffiella horikoshii TaxID=79883 RepID=UPI001F2CE831|nr:rhomboid family intramembrane serine protease [Sutcliffiella horikoshii]MCG1023997.1 rhomboid family intramembrane serine protease [Sutcliffiella horikoshii]
MFVRTENFRTFRRLYPIITIIVAIHLVLWLIVQFSPTFLNLTVGFNLLVWQGEYWRLVTPIFLHASLTHLLFNSLSLVLFGPGVERMLGKGKFIAFYLLGGILANVATLLLRPEIYTHLGASGAIFAIFGLYFYMVFLRPDLLDRANSQVILTILVIGLVMTFLNQNINVIAHLFGFFAGTVLAPFFLGRGPNSAPRSFRAIFPKTDRPRGPRSGKQTIVWIVLIGLVLVGVLARYM